jgi:hypothetical protein
MLKMSRRSLGKPVDIRARNAVGWARFVLGVCNLELTTERKGKWHLLSQIFAETSRDLRHHLAASLAKNPWRHDEIVVP